MPNFGEQFIHQKDPKLHTSQPVEHEQARRKRADEETSQKPVDKLEDWMQVLEHTHTGHRDDPRVLERIKEFYHNDYIIKAEDVPESAFILEQRIAREMGYGTVEITEEFKERKIEQIINNQRQSLDKWIDYLSSEDAQYPTWAKYYAFRSMLEMGKFQKKEDEQGKEKGGFQKRAKDTIASFPPLNPRALALTIGVLRSKVEEQAKPKEERKPVANKSVKLDDKAFQGLLSTENFSKIYAQFLLEMPEYSTEKLQETKGRWVKYEKNSDPKPLVDSLEGYPLEWCTADIDTARTQLEGGDFYVYYSINEAGEAVIPRLAIRMQDDNIAEDPRGIAPDQNLDPYIVDVLDKKLKEFGPQGDAYKKKSADMKLLTEIDNKQKAGQTLTPDDLRFLYEIDHKIEGFGYDTDPRIAEIRQSRKPKEDAPLALDCEPSEIAWGQTEVSENTKSYIGPLYPGVFQKDFEHIYTSFPEGRIWQKQITIGDKSKGQLKAELKKENIEITGWAKQVLGKAKIILLERPEQMELVILTVADLGFSQDATIEQIYARAKELGLELCPAEAGPQLRLQYNDQPKNEYLNVGIEPIFGAVGRPRVFSVARTLDGQRWLDAWNAGSDGRWSPDLQWVFLRHKPVLKVQPQIRYTQEPRSWA